MPGDVRNREFDLFISYARDDDRDGIPELDPIQTYLAPRLDGPNNNVGRPASAFSAVMMRRGDVAAALRFAAAAVELLEAKSEADPENADYQRGLAVSCLKMTQVYGSAGSRQVMDWARRAHGVLNDMKTRGMFISPADAQAMEELEKIVRGDG